MIRWRSQRPTHVAAAHSPQSPKAQFLGEQVSAQSGACSQGTASSCVPRHCASLAALNKKSTLASCDSTSSRLRIVVLWPHLPLHLGSVHSVQPQKEVSSQTLVQVETSMVLLMSHGLPQELGSSRTDRCRVCWPPHSVHSDQSDHSSHWQSWQTTASQGCVLQGAVTMRESSHGLPPPLEAASSSRLRLCCPPPQGAVHLDHSVQRLIEQSCGSSPPHSAGAMSATPGLQGSMAFSARVKQAVPFAAE
mmetsp:Transcript_117356/g.373957  ORF Transcript_117356/g.373957 Transcript_117356/m.373957 type:complete len:249 (+) Transcript_117356:2362-3108(+)